MSRARIALIGAGQMGREHAGLLRSHSGTELVAACDAFAGAEQNARDGGVPFFTDYVEMLDRLRPDGAVIALPNALHAEAAIACLERGIPPLLERARGRRHDGCRPHRRVGTLQRRAGAGRAPPPPPRPTFAAPARSSQTESSGAWSRSTA